MKAVVFSGTSEGKEISLYMADKGICVAVCVATEYGREVMPEHNNVSVEVGRKAIAEMAELIRKFDFVIDATHPYARKATENIKEACRKENKEYIRILREEQRTDYDKVIWFDNIESIAEYISKIKGNIFISGSKDCKIFNEDDRKRIIVRILDNQESRKETENKGFKKVICENPPFGIEKNIKHFSENDIDFVVTKSSGKSGGFLEKIRACEILGITVLALKRPEEKGISIEEAKKIINSKIYKRFPLFIDISDKKILVIGSGKVASRRINILLKYGADITVISKEMETRSNVRFIQKEFQDDDITDDYFLVISAADSREVNQRAAEICKEKGINVSVADCAEECTFFFPSVILTDELSIGIVSDGKNHKLVKQTRKKIGGILLND